MLDAHKPAVAISAIAIALACAAPAARADVDPAPSHASGSLIAGGQLSGTVEISFLVNPAGNYTGTITVDGHALVSAQVTIGVGHLFLDTTQLVDASHSVLVTVGDGGITDTVWSGTIETLNAPQGGVPTLSGTPAVGATLTAMPGSWLPSPTAIGYQWQRCAVPSGVCSPVAGATGATYALGHADSGSQIEVEVLASDADGTTVATSAPTVLIVDGDASAAGASGAANGGAPCTAPQLTAELGGHSTQTVMLGEGATLQGALRCGDEPVAGAALQLEVSDSSGRAPSGYVTVQTAADGSFIYALQAGPSREVTVSYRADTGQAEPSALATVTLLVKPRITLSIAPRATSNHHTITFSGRVLGGHIARGGLPLQLEYREGSRWMVYTEVLAGADGRYRYRYTFERTTIPITYTFRVAIPATGVAGYPYQPVASRAYSVHVTP